MSSRLKAPRLKASSSKENEHMGVGEHNTGEANNDEA